MKKIIYLATVIALSANVSCKKSTAGNSNVLTTENRTNEAASDSGISALTERYVAEDGSSALVTFQNSNEGKSISIRSNNKMISAPEKKEGVYSNYDFEIVNKNDSITITQGNNVIKLKKARGQ